VEIDLEEITIRKIFNEFVYFLLYGAGIFSVLKITIWVYSQRLFSLFYVWKHRHKFESHRVFMELDVLEKSKQIYQQTIEPGKKELAGDIFYLEIVRFKQLLRMNLKRVYKRSWKEYITNFKEFNSKSICELFINEFKESRHILESMARMRFTRFGMSQKDFNRFWQLYEEMFYTYEAVLTASIDTRSNSNDVYRTLYGILDDHYTIARIINMTLAHKFNLLNGRAKGITYRGNKIAHNTRH
jgi:hypothetical protein